MSAGGRDRDLGGEVGVKQRRQASLRKDGINYKVLVRSEFGKKTEVECSMRGRYKKNRAA